jgi:hypothetical protein
MSNVSGLGLATKGYTGKAGGTPGAASASILTITVTATHLDVQFDEPVTLAPYGNNAAAWTISAAGGAYPVTVTNASNQAADTIRLLVTEMTNGGAYTLHTVVGLVQNVGLTDSNKAENKAFTGVGVAPVISTAVAQSAKTVLVGFDKDMTLADLANPAKFTIIGPAPAITPLNVLAASVASSSSALLTTDVMEPYYLGPDFYTVTSTAKSLAGN